MYVGRKPVQNGDPLDDAAHTPRREPCGTARPLETAQPQIQKKRGSGRCAHGSVDFGQPYGTLSDVGNKSRGCRLAQGNIALLLPFPADKDRFVSPMNVLKIEPGELGVADAAAIKKLDDRFIARGPTDHIIPDGVDDAI